MLKISKLHAKVNSKEILKGVNLHIKKGEFHVIMGPNGTGKSTLLNVIMGHPLYTVTKGEMIYKNENIQEYKTWQRAQKGVFLLFQNSQVVQDVNMLSFLHAIHKKNVLTRENVTEKEARRNKELRQKLSLAYFKKDIKKEVSDINLHEDFLSNGINEGLSGGEKKRSEIIQMKMLKPNLVLIDELDSGLDVDSLKELCREINDMKGSYNFSLLVVTHYSRILKYLKPDIVHLFQDGVIQKTGDINLAYELESVGYKSE